MGREECEIRSAAPSLESLPLCHSSTLLHHKNDTVLVVLVIANFVTIIIIKRLHHLHEHHHMCGECLRRALGAGHDRYLAGCPATPPTYSIVFTETRLSSSSSLHHVPYFTVG